MSTQRRRQLQRLMSELGRTQQGWSLIFDYHCQVPIARSVLRHHLRYDLSKIRDWYDGAPFHQNDTKLQEHFDAGEYLQLAKAEAGLKWSFLITHTRKRVLQTLWFNVITRAIQLRIAGAC